MADYGTKMTDRAVRETERRLSRVYREAARDIKSKMKDWEKAHAERERKYRQQLAEGKITQADFDAWMRGQVFQGNQWKARQEQINQILLNADKAAAQIVNEGKMGVFAANANYVGYKLERGVGVRTGFNLYDQNTVSRLIRKDHDMLPKAREGVQKDKSYRWYNKQVASAVTQGIVQGEGVREIAQRIVDKTSEGNYKSAVRHARTAYTGAQNAGRMEGLHQAQELGIKVKKQWVATNDDRTRDTHADLDGQIAEVDEPFITSEGDEIMYPGDPTAAPGEVYNCRCTLVYVYPDYPSDISDREPTEAQSFEEWEDMKREDQEQVDVSEDVTEQDNTVVDGEDISDTWERRPDEFDFEIEDVINAQGFDGVPRIVDAEEFDNLVKEANDGEGFIAQRTYSAPDQETLDSYRQQLYEGNWYVDCSAGGSAYGKGMYCVSDYSGELTDRMQREISDYERLGEQRIGNGQDYYAEQVYQEEMHKVTLPIDEKYRDALTDELNITDSLTQKNSEERKYVREWINGNPDLAKQLKQELAESQERGVEKGEAILNLSKEEFARRYPTKTTGSNIETFTLDTSARIVRYSEITRMYREEGRGFNDVGSFAAAKGYDAIRVDSAGYTVVLNRTKLIIRRPN